MALLYHFRDKARYSSKMTIFSYPRIRRPRLGGFPSEFCPLFAMEKWCKKFEDMFSRFVRILACDRQADRRTDRHLVTAKSALCISSWSKIFNCRWRESLKSLLFYWKTSSLSNTVDQRRFLLYKKMKYHHCELIRVTMKSCLLRQSMWKTFTDTIN